jgi:hypothetical protein
MSQFHFFLNCCLFHARASTQNQSRPPRPVPSTWPSRHEPTSALLIFPQELKPLNTTSSTFFVWIVQPRLLCSSTLTATAPSSTRRPAVCTRSLHPEFRLRCARPAVDDHREQVSPSPSSLPRVPSPVSSRAHTGGQHPRRRVRGQDPSRRGSAAWSR